MTHKGKWLTTEAKRIPEIAFELPSDAIDPRALTGLATSTEKEQDIGKYVRAQLLARYGTIVEGLQAALHNADQKLVRDQDRRECLEKARQNLKLHLIATRAVFTLPDGSAGIFTIFLILLALGLALAEWTNAAGFAARQDFQSLPLALGFTFVFPLIPLALKFGPPRLRIATGIAGLCFLVVYAKCYVSSPEAAAASALVNQLLPSQALASSALPIDWKPMLLVAQVIASTLISLLLTSVISTLAVTETTIKLNPDIAVFDTEILRLQEEIARHRLERSIPAGDLVEFENSVSVHANRLLSLVAKIAELERSRSQFLAGLQSRASDLESEVAGLLVQNNNHH